jgi:hypothetical protein
MSTQNWQEQYQTVQQRIDIFWKLHPRGRFTSEIVLINENEVIIKTSVWTDRTEVAPTTVDFAQEPVLKDGRMAGMHVELGVTSSLGRAISQLGGELSPDKKRASQTEMEKANRVLAARLLEEARLAFDKENLDVLRDLYTESKEHGVDAETIAKILELGGTLAQKLKNAPIERN